MMWRKDQRLKKPHPRRVSLSCNLGKLQLSILHRWTSCQRQQAMHTPLGCSSRPANDSLAQPEANACASQTRRLDALQMGLPRPLGKKGLTHTLYDNRVLKPYPAALTQCPPQ